MEDMYTSYTVDSLCANKEEFQRQTFTERILRNIYIDNASREIRNVHSLIFKGG